MGCLCVEDELFTEEEIIQGEFFPGKNKKSNQNTHPIEKEIRIEALNDGLLIWINENYNNLENSSYLRLLKKNKNLTIKCFENVNDAFNFLFQKKILIIKIL